MVDRSSGPGIALRPSSLCASEPKPRRGKAPQKPAFAVGDAVVCSPRGERTVLGTVTWVGARSFCLRLAVGDHQVFVSMCDCKRIKAKQQPPCHRLA